MRAIYFARRVQFTYLCIYQAWITEIYIELWGGLFVIHIESEQKKMFEEFIMGREKHKSATFEDLVFM